MERIMDMFVGLVLLFHPTDSLIAALNVLNKCDPNMLEKPDAVRVAKLKIARELIRRGVVSWDGN
jgi:hypothetical protein